MTIGARLQALRQELGGPSQLTQAQMAKLMGTSLRAYQNYERDERQPQMGHLAALHAQRVNINWLLSGEGEPCFGTHAEQADVDPKTLSAVIAAVVRTLDEGGIALPFTDLAEVISLVYVAVTDAIREANTGEANDPTALASANLERLLPSAFR